MNRRKPKDESAPTPGGLGTLAALLGAAVAAAALIAPPVFALLLRAGRAYPAARGLRDLDFVSVLTRCLLGAILLALALGGRRLGLVPLLRRTLAPARAPWSRALALAAAGLALVLALLGAGLASGAYALPAPPGMSGLLAALAKLTLAALVTALLEEILFRGALHGLLRRSGGPVLAALVGSAIFSAVHFARPHPAIHEVAGHWYSGFRQLLYLFRPPGAVYPGPEVATLFVLGLALCVLVERTGSLWPAIGLHAGLVVGMRMGMAWLVRTEAPAFWFGRSAHITNSWAGVAAGTLVLLALLRRPGPAPAPDGPP